jgi:hypothetical protein
MTGTTLKALIDFRPRDIPAKLLLRLMHTGQVTKRIFLTNCLPNRFVPFSIFSPQPRRELRVTDFSGVPPRGLSNLSPIESCSTGDWDRAAHRAHHGPAKPRAFAGWISGDGNQRTVIASRPR